MDAVTMQVPHVVDVRDDPVTEQSVAVPLVTVYETAPAVVPPAAVKVRDVPKVPEIDMSVNASWGAFSKVTVVAVEEAAR